MKALHHWVVWRYFYKDRKWTKPPLRVDSKGNASSTDQATWGDYETALAVYQSGSVDGIGIALTTDISIVGVDLDHSYNPKSKSFEPWATAIINHFNSYTEASPSGTGVRIFLKGKLPVGGHKKGNIEIYSSGRYLTVTGRVLHNSVRTVAPRQAEIDAFLAEHFPPEPKIEKGAGNAANGSGHLSDHEIIEIGFRAKNGDKLRALLDGNYGEYPSQSEAELALCSLLAFYTKDESQIDRIYRGSRLARDKWDVKHYGDGTTYGHHTIQKAMAGTEAKLSRRDGQTNLTSDYRNPPSEVKFEREINLGDLQAKAIERGELVVSFLPVLGQDKFIVKGWSHLLAAYPKTGKTELLVRLMAEWAREKILYFTEEPTGAWDARMQKLPPTYSHVTLFHGLGTTPGEILNRLQPEMKPWCS